MPLFRGGKEATEKLGRDRDATAPSYTNRAGASPSASTADEESTRASTMTMIERPPAAVTATTTATTAALAPAAPDAATPDAAPAAATQPLEPKISFFDRYLFVWVALCMLAGSLIGRFAPQVARALDRAQVLGISVPLATLLWLMIFPMLLSVDWVALREVAAVPGPVALTSATNFLVQPFLSYGVSLLFFRVFYARILPDRGLADQYVAGGVLLAAAPCTAMVLVWSLLVGGSAAYTIVQVAVNDLLTLALFVPIVSLLLGAGVTARSVRTPYAVVAASVMAFVGLPMAVAVAVRLALVWRLRGREPAQRAISRVSAAFKPVTLAGLLATLVIVFAFQGAAIAPKPSESGRATTAAAAVVHILLIAVPQTISTVLVWAFVYAVGCGLLSMPHELLAPASLIATSNFFELAVAVAVGAFGAASGAALATSVGVLVEVPVMLALVRACNALRGFADARAAGAEWGPRVSWARRLFAPQRMVEEARRRTEATAASSAATNAAAAAAAADEGGGRGQGEGEGRRTIVGRWILCGPRRRRADGGGASATAAAVVAAGEPADASGEAAAAAAKIGPGSGKEEEEDEEGEELKEARAAGEADAVEGGATTIK